MTDRLLEELEEVRRRQDAQDEELATLRRGIHNVLAVANTAQTSIDVIINELGRIAYGSADKRDRA